MLKLLLMLNFAGTIGAEVVDRIVVSVGGEIITEQQVMLSLRSAALLNGEPVKTGDADKKRAAQKMIELVLIRIEMQTSRYPLPIESQLAEALAALKKQRFGGKEEEYQAELKAKQISEIDVKDSLRWQLAILSFIDFRFRPGVQISDEEIKDYYEQDYRPAIVGKAKSTYDQMRAEILELLTQQRIDNLLDRWLNESEASTKVRWLGSNK